MKVKFQTHAVLSKHAKQLLELYTREIQVSSK